MITYDDPYFSNPALSRSDIVSLLRGPNYYKHYKDTEQKSKALDFGTAFHMYLLEPERFKKHYVVAPEGMKFNLKAGIAWKKEHEDKAILKCEDFNILMEMAANVKTHPWLADKFDGATMEQNYFFKCPETGEPLKSKPDLVNLLKGCIIDFKTSRTLNERQLGYEAVDRGFDVQGAMCVNAVASKTGLYLDFYDVFIEKNPPYDVLVTHITSEDLDRAYMKVVQAVHIYRECKSADLWPSLKPKEPIRLNLSFIEMEQHDEEDETMDSPAVY